MGGGAERKAYSPFACWLNKIITFEIKITSSNVTMPKVLEYFGFVFYFYSNEHLPIHVHVSFGEYESIFEILFENGKIKGVEVRKATGIDPLPQRQISEAKKVIEIYAREIVDKWTDFFVLKKKIKSRKITQKL
jgi:hypothetical protein